MRACSFDSNKFHSPTAFRHHFIATSFRNSHTVLKFETFVFYNVKNCQFNNFSRQSWFCQRATVSMIHLVSTTSQHCCHITVFQQNGQMGNVGICEINLNILNKITEVKIKTHYLLVHTSIKSQICIVFLVQYSIAPQQNYS